MAAKTTKKLARIPVLWRAKRRGARGCRFTKASGFQDVDLGGQLAFRAITRTHANPLPLPELANPVTPQRLHMYEDIRGVRSAADKAIAFAAIEPLHGGLERCAFRLGRETC